MPPRPPFHQPCFPPSYLGLALLQRLGGAVHLALHALQLALHRRQRRLLGRQRLLARLHVRFKLLVLLLLHGSEQTHMEGTRAVPRARVSELGLDTKVKNTPGQASCAHNHHRRHTLAQGPVAPVT